MDLRPECVGGPDGERRAVNRHHDSADVDRVNRATVSPLCWHEVQSRPQLERPATATDARRGNTPASTPGAFAPPTGAPPTAPLQGQPGGGRALGLPPWPPARPDYDDRPALAGAIGAPEQERHIRAIHLGARRQTEARHASATDRRIGVRLGAGVPERASQNIRPTLAGALPKCRSESPCRRFGH
jgi:hypothetical protein